MRIGPIWLADDIGQHLAYVAKLNGRAIEVEAAEVIREHVLREQRKAHRQRERNEPTEAVA